MGKDIIKEMKASERGANASEKGMRGSEKGMRGSKKGVRGSEMGVRGSEKGVRGSERTIVLVAEKGESLSSGALRLYASTPLPSENRNQKSEIGNQPSEIRNQKPALIIGAIDLYNYDPLNRRCAVGIMVASDYRRKGYALAMLQALESQYSSTIHCLYADIAAVNTASISLFRKAGYRECGIFKEWLEYDSHFIDNIRMQKILPNAKNLNQYQAG